MLVDHAQHRLAVADRGNNVEARLDQQPRQPFAQQHGVLGYHDSHGSSTVKTVGPPTGLSMRKVPSTPPTRSPRPGEPASGMRRGAADAVVGDRDVQAIAAASCNDVDPLRARVLGRVGQRFADDEVGDRLDGRIAARLDLDVERHGYRRPTGQARQRGVEPAIGKHRRMQPAGEITQLHQRMLGIGMGLVEQFARRLGVVFIARTSPPEIHGQRDEALLGAVMQVSLDTPALCLSGIDDPRPAALKLVDALRELRRAHAEDRTCESTLRRGQPDRHAEGDESDEDTDARDQPCRSLTAGCQQPEVGPACRYPVDPSGHRHHGERDAPRTHGQSERGYGERKLHDVVRDGSPRRAVLQRRAHSPWPTDWLGYLEIEKESHPPALEAGQSAGHRADTERTPASRGRRAAGGRPQD